MRNAFGGLLAAALLAPSALALQFVFTDSTSGGMRPPFSGDSGLHAIENAIESLSTGEYTSDSWQARHTALHAANPSPHAIGMGDAHSATVRDSTAFDDIGRDPADNVTEPGIVALLLAGLAAMGFVASRRRATF